MEKKPKDEPKIVDIRWQMDVEEFENNGCLINSD